MTDTANLGLPFIEGSQAQKHVTHNEALRILDAAIQIAVLDRTRSAPPFSPADGQRHIVAASPTGAWAGRAKSIATWQDGAWAFLAPKTGWCVWSIADNVLYVYDGAVWRDLRDLPLSLDNAARIGINTAASSPNLLSVKSNAALLAAIDVAAGGSGDARWQLSKETSAKTASVVFADAYSGRAEFGLVGDDDFRLKVSANGSSWLDAIRIDRATGRVFFPVNGGPREVLAANRTYYVRTDGSNSNDGLSNAAGGAFLTIQKAIDAIAALDVNGFTATVQVANGTYTGQVVLKNVVGFAAAGGLVIQGNNATPASVVVSTSGNAISADGIAAIWDIKDLKITTSVGNAIAASNGARVRFGNLDFGVCASQHLFADGCAQINSISNYTISGGAPNHIFSLYGAKIFILNLSTVTLTGTPAFSSSFAFASASASISAYSVTFSGAATGSRFASNNNAVIFTNSSATYFPGNAAGTTSNGGLYI